MSDLVLTNARVLTQDPARPFAGAVAIRAGRIVAVGSAAEAAAAAGAGARICDVGGRALTPGFNDCHMHILPYGQDLARADLSPESGVLDVPALVAALQRWGAANPNSEWALGTRYDQNRFPGAKHPTRADLDAAFPDRPAFVMQTSKHAGAANSVALRLAGITAETPDPDGGQIVRDATGQPTGVLLESAVDLVTDLIPVPDEAGMIAAIRRAHTELVRAGITSASDMFTGWHDLNAEITAYRKAAEQGAPVRTTLFPHAPAFGRPEETPDRREFVARYAGAPVGLGDVRIGAVKLFSDGALTTRTAALREPFVDGSGDGMLLHPPDELRSYILAAHRRGWQVAVHAIGDRAIDLVLDIYAEALGTGEAGADRRHRIEHAMLLDDGQIARFAALGVVPVVQPEFVARLGDAYVLGLGPERAARLNPTASLQRLGVGVPFSSDCPIVPGAPLDGIRAACLRRTPSGRILGEAERITAAEGLRNYTYWAAYSTFDEVETGTITPGKRADLVLLSADPAADELDSVQVDATIVGGKVVYGEL